MPSENITSSFNAYFWMRLSLINLALVAFLGVIMRYNIAYYIPGIDQKNFLHAHSHFAFAAWVSQALILLILFVLQNSFSPNQINRFTAVLWANYLSAILMAISFAINGYKGLSIFFSALSIFIFIWFITELFFHFYRQNAFWKHRWFVLAIVFGLMSSFGTAKLVSMILTKHITQQGYLGSVYWYLHFQYNGWFFFALMGIWNHYLETHRNLHFPKSVFWLFAGSVIPAYGLSILWSNPGVIWYIVIVISAIMQFAAWIQVLFFVYVNRIQFKENQGRIQLWILRFVLIAALVKFSLQLGSVIPQMSKLAFGFRPIVIAYLHLVLLAFVSVFILYLGRQFRLIKHPPVFRYALAGFMVSVLANELVLAIQGTGLLLDYALPYIDKILLGVAVAIFISVLLLLYSQFQKKLVA